MARGSKRPSLGRSELLSWLNAYLWLDDPECLHLKLKHIEDGKNGAVSALILDSVLFRLGKKRRVPLHRVKWCARSQYDVMNNYRLVQDALRATGSMKEVPTSGLLKGNFRLVFDWLTWLRRFVSATLSTRDGGAEWRAPPAGYDMHDRRSLCLGVPRPSSALTAVRKRKKDKDKEKTGGKTEVESTTRKNSEGSGASRTDSTTDMRARTTREDGSKSAKVAREEGRVSHDGGKTKVAAETKALQPSLPGPPPAPAPPPAVSAQVDAAVLDRIKRAHSILSAADARCRGACSLPAQSCAREIVAPKRQRGQLQTIWKEEMPWNSEEFRAVERRHLDDREEGLTARLALREGMMMMALSQR